MNTKKASKTYIIILMSLLLSKVLGFLREILLASCYGKSPEAQAFTAASQIPNTIFDITMGTAIASVFIPVLNEYIVNKDEKKASRFTSNFATLVFLFSAVICSLGMIFPNIAIKLNGSGLSGETLELAIKLLRIILPMIFFASLSYVFVGVLQSRGKFTVPALISVVSNLVLIIYFLFFNKFGGITGLGVAFLIGWILQFVFLMPSVVKTKYKYSFVLDLKDEGMRKSLVLAIPILISSWAQPINSLIATNFGSYIDNGAGVSILRYGYTLYFVVAGVFSYALTNLMFPELSRQFYLGNKQKAGELGANMLSTVTSIILPVSLLFIALSNLLIKTVYQRGAFTAYDAQQTAGVLAMYSLGMLAFSWQEILNKFFYSMQKSYIPMIAAIIGIAVNLAGVFILRIFMGINGIALATAVSSIAMSLFLLICAKRNIKNIITKPMIISMIKSLISSLICAVCAFFISRQLNLVLSDNFFGWAGNLVISGICGIAVYIIALVVMRSNEIMQLKSILKRSK